MLPRENPFRTLHVVRAYWLTSSDGSSARAGGGPKRKLSVLIVISARAPFICDLATRIDSATVDHECADASGSFDRSPTSSLCLRGKCLRQPRTSTSGRVGNPGRNAQFHFGSRVDLAPYCQLASYECGAFPHARQAIMSLPALRRENRCINSFSIIPQPQPEALIVIADFGLDLLCVCMKKGIPERFGSNLIHFVAEDGMQIPRLALNGYTERRAVAD